MTGLYLAIIQALKISICCNNVPIPPELSTKRQTILRHALGSISFLECNLWYTRYFKPVLLCSVAQAIHLYGLFVCLFEFFLFTRLAHLSCWCLPFEKSYLSLVCDSFIWKKEKERLHIEHIPLSSPQTYWVFLLHLCIWRKRKATMHFFSKQIILIVL